MIKFMLGLVLGLSPLWALAQTDGDVDDLLLALAPVKQLQGDFTQRQFGQDNALLVESSGKFRLLRPGYFSWEILAPDAQLIIAGPEFLWHHDRDLETVTRRPVTSDAQMTPLQLLGGNDAALRENFDVAKTAVGTFVLTPLVPDAGFQQLTLYLDESTLTGMEIRDNLNQSIVIKFSEVDDKSPLTSVDFEFVPPAGADLFYYDE